MPSSDLKELCIKAYENQMKALIESEGEDVRLLQILKTELKEVDSFLFVIMILFTFYFFNSTTWFLRYLSCLIIRTTYFVVLLTR